MNKKPVFYLLALLGIGILWSSNARGPGAAQSADRTGSPLSSDACVACHQGGDFGATMQAQLLKGMDTIRAYEPGESYTLKIEIKADGASGYGFQAVMLDSMLGSVGTYEESTPAGMAMVTVDGRTYIEQNQTSTVGTFEIEWTAPQAGTGPVTLYAGGNAANSNSSPAGDDTDTISVIFEEELTSSLTDIVQADDISLYPTLANDFVKVSWTRDLETQAISLHDLNGRQLQSYQSTQLGVDESVQLNTATLNSGYYLIYVRTNKGNVAKRFIKL